MNVFLEISGSYSLFRLYIIKRVQLWRLDMDVCVATVVDGERFGGIHGQQEQLIISDVCSKHQLMQGDYYSDL